MKNITTAIAAMISRPVGSSSHHGCTTISRSRAITPRSRYRWSHRGTSLNAPAGPATTAAFSRISRPISAGIRGSGCWIDVMMSAKPRMYSTIWCIQNGRRTRSIVTIPAQ